MDALLHLIGSQTFKIDQQLDSMKIIAKSSGYPQSEMILGQRVSCDFEHGKRMIWEFQGIRVARAGLAQLLIANAR